jgi:polyisoprenoid-binding protein YceI
MTTELQTEQGNVVRVPAGTWHVDPAHSSIEFEVKHMMIATVRGRFKEFEGTIEAAEDIADSRVRGVVQTGSIDTNEPDRDAHLRSADFLDTATYPEARFESTRIVPRGGPNYRVVGDLTIKDVTREVELDATVEGADRDPWGNERVGVRLRATINRSEFGLSWQRLLETGGFLVGEHVKLLVDVSAVEAGAQ